MQFKSVILCNFLLLLFSNIITVKIDSQNISKKSNEPLKKPEKKVASNEIFHKPPLYYYRIYKNERLGVPKKIPIKQHYLNERKIRKQIYDQKEKLTNLSQNYNFKLNIIKHQILAIENQIGKLILIN